MSVADEVAVSVMAALYARPSRTATATAACAPPGGAYHAVMARPLARLFVDADLAEGSAVDLDRSQAHYLKDVLRLAPGDAVALFNGRDGEWRAGITALGRKAAQATPHERTRPQPAANGPRLIFAPVKKSGTDFIIEKATELGAARLSPVITEFTDTARLNIDRARANAIEAAAQCRRLDIPAIDPPGRLDALMRDWPHDHTVLVADEHGGGAPLLPVLDEISQGTLVPPAFVIGPQGGFSETEVVFLRGLPFVTTVDLGPRILRAETAVAAVLSCWQAARGDWRGDLADNNRGDLADNNADHINPAGA